MSSVGDIRARGWTQGSILEVDAALSEVLSVEVGTQYIVVSHPCDVVSDSLERDPYVELVRITAIEAVDGNYTLGKNSRRLHMDGDGLKLEANAADRETVDRKLLGGVDPVSTLTEQDRRVLSAWLASKYARPAFADNFNDRIKPAAPQIARVLKRAGTFMSGIYVATTLDELDDEIAYPVSIAVTMRSGDFDDAALFAVVNEGVDVIRSVISPLSGITLLNLAVFSEDDVSLTDLRTYARWDYDSISFREGETAIIPPAI